MPFPAAPSPPEERARSGQVAALARAGSGRLRRWYFPLLAFVCGPPSVVLLNSFEVLLKCSHYQHDLIHF
ncbi:hypothetical protein AV530_010937 [Patagioenas fasciata monilis]|uniref:Uncharacterized protein n=1 Tax=Patagioenas fasciata monilis TaxID=372326 RepID=A0A1V4K9V3_PATFA|nr:hypothetical protein AV530_010937 [Patagioenas fasciata monilis]